MTDGTLVYSTAQVPVRGRAWGFRQMWHAARNKVAGAFGVLAVLAIVTPSAANAAPAGGLLNGSETTFFSAISGFLTGNLLPLVFVLAAVVIGATMLIKYGRKAVSS